MFRQWEFGELVVDPFEIWWKGEKVVLTATERQIVLRLLLRIGEAVTWRTLIIELGFGDDFNDSTYMVLRVWVGRVRKRFYAVDPDFTQLETVKGGFRWR